jgi:hypothetical protein
VALEHAVRAAPHPAGSPVSQILYRLGYLDSAEAHVEEGDEVMKPRHLVRKGGILLVRTSGKLVLKTLVLFIWKVPAKVYDTWVILSFYGVLVAACGVYLDLVELTDALWYAALWAYVARWRWNWKKLHQGIRPLYERRTDL